MSLINGMQIELSIERWLMNERYLPICTHCYAVRVEPQRARALRPTCAACGEELARQVKHTIVPMNKSNYMLVTDRSVLSQLNPKVTT
jgi:transposase-like protein